VETNSLEYDKDYDAQIVLRVKDNTLSLHATNNLDEEQIYILLCQALQPLHEMSEEKIKSPLQ
jgi:hypothetical protein